MERKKNKLDPASVKVNDYMCMVNWVRVKEIGRRGESMVVEDLDHGLAEIEVKGKSLIETCFSANQFAQEVKATRTEVAELFVSSLNRPVAVCFDKADGEERVMYCRLVSSEHLMGRSMVEDLAITKGHKLRQVDHRTLKWLIVDGTKYSVK